MADGLGVWVLDVPIGFGDAALHSHHALQITLALTGEVRVEQPGGTFAGTGVTIASDIPHRMTGSGLIAIVFVDPDGAMGRGVAAALLGGAPAAPIGDSGLRRSLAPLARALDPDTTRDAMLAIARTAIDRIAPRIAPPADPRLAPILAALPGQIDQTLAKVAESAGVFLSPERLRHLFAEHTGLPYKTYMLWLRMNRALGEYASGRSLTEAAHAAGFSDSAHLSRVFRRTFGLPATTLTRI